MRYIKNMSAISPEENVKIREARVCVVGCGGLGGYLIEMLGRLGIGYMTVIDGDAFNETNLNRQLLCDTKTLGRNKAEAAAERMAVVNPDVRLTPVETFIDAKNASTLLGGHDLIMDALDNVSTRLMVSHTASLLGIPFVHGAIAGWYGQVSAVFPGDNTLERIYKNSSAAGHENKLGNPAFAPALIASIQTAEAVKIIAGRGDILRNKVLFVNLLNHEYDTINLL